MAMVDTLWDNQMIFEDFRSFHRICDVTGGKKCRRFQNDPKHPTAVCHRGVNLAWWVHVGMTNSLVALNLEIWEIFILFATSKGKKGVKRDPKLQKNNHIFITIAQLELIHFGRTNLLVRDIHVRNFRSFHLTCHVTVGEEAKYHI